MFTYWLKDGESLNVDSLVLYVKMLWKNIKTFHLNVHSPLVVVVCSPAFVCFLFKREQRQFNQNLQPINLEINVILRHSPLYRLTLRCTVTLHSPVSCNSPWSPPLRSRFYLETPSHVFLSVFTASPLNTKCVSEQKTLKAPPDWTREIWPQRDHSMRHTAGTTVQLHAVSCPLGLTAPGSIYCRPHTRSHRWCHGISLKKQKGGIRLVSCFNEKHHMDPTNTAEQRL